MRQEGQDVGCPYSRSLQSAAQLTSRSQLDVFASGSISVIPKPSPNNRATRELYYVDLRLSEPSVSVVL